MRELPQLDETRCSGCGDCVAVCPVDCLEMRGKVPWLARPVVCISCAGCMAICPVEAISIQPLPPA